MTVNERFQVVQEITHTFTEGWGVMFECLYAGDNEDGLDPDSITEVEGYVCRIARPLVQIIGGAPCVPVESEPQMTYCPVANFQIIFADEAAPDDTHDLRDRWFATQEDAEAHLAYTLNRWNHPSPWESFVTL